MVAARSTAGGSSNAGGGAPEDANLPRLRQELRLTNGAADLAGNPTWLIFDPARYKYFQLGQRAFHILCEWSAGSVGRLKRRFALRNEVIDDAEVEAVIRFLFANNLAEKPAEGGASAYLNQVNSSRKSWAQQAAHGYLFFRIPLFRPDAFLKATYPFIAFMFSRFTLTTVILLSMIGVYMTSRQWDEFWATFLHFFSIEGFIAYGFTLVGIKILHELGHAYCAVRHKCRVPTMGIAFMVLFPLLYTDVTDAWRLKRRRDRLQIDSAGIAVELMIAGLATFAWAFLPDGPMRSVAFFLATTSWILSLAVNLNPFMRFDGYHLLADALGVHNLQQRGFAFGKWKLRQVLFGFDDSVPEIVSRRHRITLIIYAYCTWIYRFFLFLGIAVLVYNLTFKLLGIVLAGIELVFFIGLPIYKELAVWWTRRGDIVSNRRGLLSLSLFVVLMVLLWVPLPLRISLPALYQAHNQVKIYPPVAGKLTALSVEEGAIVQTGDPIFALSSLPLHYQLRETSLRIDLLKKRLGRQVADQEERANIQVNINSLLAEENQLRSIHLQNDDLKLDAPISGTVTYRDETVRVGDVVSSSSVVVEIASFDQMEVRAFVRETDRHRLKIGAEARFVPEDLFRSSIKAAIVEVSEAGESEIALPYFQSIYGGGIAVEQGEDNTGKMKPIEAVYQVRFLVEEGGSPVSDKALRGTIHVDAVAESFGIRAFRQIAKVFLRELGL